MFKSGILNPDLICLLARIRHTNTLVIADRGFPFWPRAETIDIALVDDIPTVLDVIRAIRPNFIIGRAWMADEFIRDNTAEVQKRFAAALEGVPTTFEPHDIFKDRVPSAVGLIRTGDSIQYANIIIESA
jgi:D-ribose pyranase